jgi:calcium-dependent protein kinase
VAYTYITA